MKCIVTADWHIRGTTPRCRNDKDWMATQRNALKSLYNYAIEYDCDICVVGDLFHTVADTSFECIQLIQELALNLKNENKRLYILAGNHDLPYHSEDNIDKSAIGIVLMSDNVYHISDIENVSAPNFGGTVNKDAEIVFTHVLTFPDRESMPPNVNAVTAYDLLDDYPKAKYIFTGDYHHAFHVEEDNRHVINAGCLIRQVADMKDYKPSCYYVDTQTNVIKQLYIADDGDMVDDSYLVKEEEREKRIEEFVDKLKATKNISLDFADNVAKALTTNKLGKEFEDVVNALIQQRYFEYIEE